ncbi:MAG: SMP-30/gluconolactonase/LRE family protein [Methanomicrobiales archaeon]
MVSRIPCGIALVILLFLITPVLGAGDGYDFLTEWGSSGTGEGQFDYPRGIAIDDAGYVYVTDSWNNRVQKFTSDGDFVTRWGSAGSESGEFSDPGGIAADGDGYVCVADTGNHRIQRFTDDGSFVSAWGERGDGAGEFELPQYVAIDSAGYIYPIIRT